MVKPCMSGGISHYIRLAEAVDRRTSSEMVQKQSCETEISKKKIKSHKNLKARLVYFTFL